VSDGDMMKRVSRGFRGAKGEKVFNIKGKKKYNP